MKKLGLVAYFTILVYIVLLAAAQGGNQPPEVDQALFVWGEQLFEANCAICHRSTGLGNPPVFPALAGNDALENVDLIISNVHEGQGAMPAFPQLEGYEVAALATYVRNAWDNAFGGVDPEHVAAQIVATATLRSVWDGIYTFAQAERGEPLYSGECSECHGFLWVRGPAGNLVSTALPVGEPLALAVGGERVDMSNPPVAPTVDDEEFLRRWEGQTVASLYLFVRQSMPSDNAGLLSDQQYVDIIAFLFAIHDFPMGEEELPPDVARLSEILIRRESSPTE